jgi:hypothetical protein
MWSFLNEFLLPSSVLEFYYVYDGMVALDTVPSRLYWLAGVERGQLCTRQGFGVGFHGSECGDRRGEMEGN